ADHRRAEAGRLSMEEVSRSHLLRAIIKYLDVIREVSIGLTESGPRAAHICHRTGSVTIPRHLIEGFVCGDAWSIGNQLRHLKIGRRVPPTRPAQHHSIDTSFCQVEAMAGNQVFYRQPWHG